MIDPYTVAVRESLNKIIPDISGHLKDLPQEDALLADQVVAELIKRTCVSQHAGNIVAGRAAFKNIPTNWLESRLQAIVATQLNLNDDWEYRRLLELLQEVKSELLEYYISVGRGSANAEVRLAASDFSSSIEG